MFYQKNPFLIAFILFLIGSFHTMIFAFFQLPTHFSIISDYINTAFTLKAINYSSAILAAIFHRRLSKFFGLKTLLYLGLFCNLLGLSFLLLNELDSPNPSIITSIFSAVLFGVSLTSVINSIITYIIGEFPKHISLSIVIFFGALNGGIMMAPFVVELFSEFKSPIWIYFFFISLMLFSITFIHRFFFERFHQNQTDLLENKETLLVSFKWKLKYFFLAIVFYAIIETTLFLWGYIDLQTLFGSGFANHNISLFWLFMILGQFILLIPIYYFPDRKIFPLLILSIITSLFLLATQKNPIMILFSLALGGFGCSVIFPIILSLVEKEIMKVTDHKSHANLSEWTTSFLLAGYWLGASFIDLLSIITKENQKNLIEIHFMLAIALTLLMSLICFFFFYQDKLLLKKHQSL